MPLVRPRPAAWYRSYAILPNAALFGGNTSSLQILEAAFFTVEMIVNNKREARIAYYEGIKQATLDHIKVTEDGLRNLKDVSSEKIEKLVADVHKRHLKLLKHIEQLIKEESRS
jgi:hypothetical protein